jgi:hypothetical protein
MDKSDKPILAAASCTTTAAEDSGCGGDGDDDFSSIAAVDMVQRFGWLPPVDEGESWMFVWRGFCYDFQNNFKLIVRFFI